MDLDQFSCPNPACPDHGKKNRGNIALYTRYGRKQVRLLVCTTCNKTFSELHGTPFWDSRLDWDEIEKIYRTLLEGNGIRATARAHNLSKNTVKRYLHKSGQNRANFKITARFLQDRGAISHLAQLLWLLQRFNVGLNGHQYLCHTITEEWVKAGCPEHLHSHHV